MYYASIGILSFLVHIIINWDILFRIERADRIPALNAYKNFLTAVSLFYITDVLWELLEALGLKRILFIETEIYYVIMGFTVLFWTRFVIDYLNKPNWFSKTIRILGWIFFSFQMIILFINLFIPIAFWFDDKANYHTENARNLNYIFQFVMFFVCSAYMDYEIFKASGTFKHRYHTIQFFGIVMAIFVVLQAIYPLMPFYSIGFLLGTCIMHTFVLEDERRNRNEELQKLLQIEKIQAAELGNARQMAFKDPLTGVKSKSAYQEDALCVESKIENHDLHDFGLIIFDINDLKKTNDTKGHEEGDKIIKAGTKIICQTFKHSPIYRIGGDEFAAFLTGEDLENHKTLLKAFNRQIEKNLKEDKVVVACGFSTFNPEKDSTFSQIFGRADSKMYKRKSELKNLTANL